MSLICSVCLCTNESCRLWLPAATGLFSQEKELFIWIWRDVTTIEVHFWCCKTTLLWCPANCTEACSFKTKACNPSACCTQQIYVQGLSCAFLLLINKSVVFRFCAVSKFTLFTVWLLLVSFIKENKTLRCFES